MITMTDLKKFVKIYQDAESVADVAKAMSWKHEKVASQASQLRKKGIPLKKFSREKLTDDDLAELAGLCNKK
jgi:hypothetical protein